MVTCKGNRAHHPFRRVRTGRYTEILTNMISDATSSEEHDRVAMIDSPPEPATPQGPSLDNNSTGQLKLVIVGHVDHGKSTFVGRLLNDTGSLPEDKLEQLRKIAESRGMPFEWANLMDSLQAERDQNITIDTAQIWFRTKQRQYVIIDAPGHKEFLKNMITGAASAEAALLLIDAHEGIQENSRRHGYLLHFLGIRQVAVLVNKMDLVGHAQERFHFIETEYRVFLKSIGVEPRIFIPISARDGDNIAVPSSKMSWWTGPTVLSVLDQFQTSQPPSHLPLRFSVQDVYRFDERRILAGRVESGTLKVGDRLQFCPANKVSTVKTIERWNAPTSGSAAASESIGITITEQIFVERGAIGARESALPYNLNRIKGRIFWMSRAPLRKGKLYKLKLLAQEVDCEIDSIEQILDATTLQTLRRDDRNAQVARFEIAEFYLRTKRPIAFDAHSEIINSGRFVICDGFDVAGGGIIVDDAYPRLTSDALHKSQNIYWTPGIITHEARVKRNGHAGRVIWLTGLPAAGKSSIATELEHELFNLGMQAYMLDGDKVRHGICSDLGFSPEDRSENIRRIGEMAKIMADAGFICITAFISPYRADRDAIRQRMEPEQFVEVYVNAPLEVCEARDPKGLYAKARRNEIPNFTGISAPYEPPEKPELELRTNLLSVAESVFTIVDFLHKEKIA
jgi:bifunctional enzyme CysN/CysC